MRTGLPWLAGRKDGTLARTKDGTLAGSKDGTLARSVMHDESDGTDAARGFAGGYYVYKPGHDPLGLWGCASHTQDLSKRLLLLHALAHPSSVQASPTRPSSCLDQLSAQIPTYMCVCDIDRPLDFGQG